MQHERQDGAEFFVKRKTELPVIVKAFVACRQNPAAVCLSFVTLYPLCGVDYGAPGFASTGVGIHPHDGRVVC